MTNFCTYFDKNYLLRGLALYRSLERTCPDFHLYILAFDDDSRAILHKLSLKHATIISLSDFEDQELLKAKQTRTAVEYYWTCTPSLILYVIERYGLELCTYLDADLFFFADPAPLLGELGHKSVLITDHNYDEGHSGALLYGRFCVQFMPFRNDPPGLEVLRWWRNACLDWCYNRVEDGKFGDQKYLDSWLEKFPSVHILKHEGGGVAFWNLSRYEFSRHNVGFTLTSKHSRQEFELIFYHFHKTKLYELLGRVFAKGYNLSYGKTVVKDIYNTYAHAIKSGLDEIRRFDPQFDSGFRSSNLEIIITLIKELVPLPLINLLKKIKYGKQAKS